ncbi:MAG: Omp28-related outer membrane protein [Bacteroidales bacterium]|nr:Omp28-related outer membrane protein [Bacteroidales bacterium]
MRKLLLSLMACAVTLFSVNTSKAEGQLFLGYCDGQIATKTSGTITGQSGTNATIAEVIRIPASMLAPYQGLQIAAVHAGLPEASAYPESLTGWIAASISGERMTTGTLSAPVAGWNTITLDQPYTITGNEAELWIGFEFVQPKKLNVISFAGETYADGCWVGKNGKYTNFGTRGFGSLPVEACIEGDNLPQHDLSILSATNAYSVAKLGDPIKMNMRISNRALTAAENPIIEVSLNGILAYTYEYPGTLNYRDKADLQLEIPTSVITEDCEVAVEANLKWADGSTDEFAEDNVRTFAMAFAKIPYARTMVVEEATGGWCGYCVRGLVGMAYMRENYPDTFLGIGVHNGDEYVVSAYDHWMGYDTGIEGYPSAVVNRAKIIDPNSAEMEQNLKNMYPLSEFGLKLAAKADEDGKVKFTVEFASLISEADAQYNMAFVVLEDKLPINQSNYYAGGGLGPMGGFEDLPSHCDIEIDDVARGIYPSVKGSSELVPAQITRGETYTIEHKAVLPTIADGNNVWAAVLLTNRATGEIVQAAKVSSIEGLAAGIQQVSRDAETGIETIFDLQGRRIDGNATGIVIRNGRISFQR